MTNNIVILYPLILTFSLREKALMVFPDGHYLSDEQRRQTGWIGVRKCEVIFKRALSRG